MGSTANFAEPRPASPLKKLIPLSLSKKGDTEGFIRGTAQEISSPDSVK
jgi:hypothetical protein